MSEDEIKHPLATLMKQKYGVTKQSSLRLNSDDSLFVVFCCFSKNCELYL